MLWKFAARHLYYSKFTYIDQIYFLVVECASGRTSILDTAGRKTESLADAVATAHDLVSEVEAPDPPVCRRVLRRRPEVAAVGKKVKNAIVVPFAARKASKSAAVGGAGIGR